MERKVDSRGGWGRVALVTLGLLALDLWCDLMGHGSAFAASSDLVAGAVTNSRVFWSLSFVLFCPLMALFPQVMERLERPGDVTACVLACTGTVLYALAPAMGGAAVATAALLVVMNGVCYGWVEVRLLAECARLCGFAPAIVAIAASQAAKVPPAFLASALPFGPQVGVDAALALAILVVLALLRRSRTGIVAAVETQRLSISPADQTNILTLLILLPVMNAFARALSDLGFWGGDNVYLLAGLPGAMLSVLLFCALVAATFSQCSGENVVGRLFLSLAVLLGCLVVFERTTLAQAGMPELWADAFASATELYSHYLFWFVAVAAIRMVDMHPYRLAALTELSMSAMALPFGLALQGFSGLSRFLVNGALFVVAIVAMALLWRMRSMAVEAPEVREAGDVCARLAAEHGLTPRETQVLELLAQGRSRVFIQEELSLSDSTVKAHTSHVYQKLGVRSKQELITLVHGE